jgi:UDP-N-acetyl-D-galactosamine dehydrogenase
MEEIHDADCVILAVAHREFVDLTPERLDRLFAPMPNDEKVIIDIKSILPKDQLLEAGYRYWRL